MAGPKVHATGKTKPGDVSERVMMVVFNYLQG